MFYFSKLCCICLKTNKKLFNVNSTQRDDICLWDKYNFCIFDFEEEQPNTLPIYVCNTCKKELETFYSFKNKCVTNYRILFKNISKLENVTAEENKFSDLQIPVASKRCTNNHKNTQLNVYPIIKRTNICFNKKYYGFSTDEIEDIQEYVFNIMMLIKYATSKFQTYNIHNSKPKSILKQSKQLCFIHDGKKLDDQAITKLDASSKSAINYLNRDKSFNKTCLNRPMNDKIINSYKNKYESSLMDKDFEALQTNEEIFDKDTIKRKVIPNTSKISSKFQKIVIHSNEIVNIADDLIYTGNKTSEKIIRTAVIKYAGTKFDKLKSIFDDVPKTSHHSSEEIKSEIRNVADESKGTSRYSSQNMKKTVAKLIKEKEKLKIQCTSKRKRSVIDSKKIVLNENDQYFDKEEIKKDDALSKRSKMKDLIVHSDKNVNATKNTALSSLEEMKSSSSKTLNMEESTSKTGSLLINANKDINEITQYSSRVTKEKTTKTLIKNAEVTNKILSTSKMKKIDTAQSLINNAATSKAKDNVKILINNVNKSYNKPSTSGTGNFCIISNTSSDEKKTLLNNENAINKNVNKSDKTTIANDSKLMSQNSSNKMKKGPLQTPASFKKQRTFRARKLAHSNDIVRISDELSNKYTVQLSSEEIKTVATKLRTVEQKKFKEIHLSDEETRAKTPLVTESTSKKLKWNEKDYNDQVSLKIIEEARKKQLIMDKYEQALMLSSEDSSSSGNEENIVKEATDLINKNLKETGAEQISTSPRKRLKQSKRKYKSNSRRNNESARRYNDVQLAQELIKAARTKHQFQNEIRDTIIVNSKTPDVEISKDQLEKHKNFMKQIEEKTEVNQSENESKASMALSKYLQKKTIRVPLPINPLRVKIFKCKFCFKKYQKKKLLYHHYCIQHTFDDTCPLCPEKFDTIGEVKEHIFEKHYTLPAPICYICNKRFARMNALDQHLLFVHEKKRPFVCEICNKTFSRKHILKLHMYTHYGIKKHKCNICNSTFVQKNCLERHMFKHSGTKPYVCKFCDNKYVSDLALRNHILRIHENHVIDTINTTNS